MGKLEWPSNDETCKSVSSFLLLGVLAFSYSITRWAVEEGGAGSISLKSALLVPGGGDSSAEQSPVSSE
jgi:hypothetical protein